MAECESILSNKPTRASVREALSFFNSANIALAFAVISQGVRLGLSPEGRLEAGNTAVYSFSDRKKLVAEALLAIRKGYIVCFGDEREILEAMYSHIDISLKSSLKAAALTTTMIALRVFSWVKITTLSGWDCVNYAKVLDSSNLVVPAVLAAIMVSDWVSEFIDKSVKSLSLDLEIF